MPEDGRLMKLFSRQQGAAGALIAAVIIGVIGSGIWDMVAKPGLSRLGRLILTVVTFGSEVVRNYPYSSAALDPYPLPALIFLHLAVGIPLILATRRLSRECLVRRSRLRFIRRFRKARDLATKSEDNSGRPVKPKLRDWVQSRRRRVLLILFALYFVMFLYAYVAVSIVNQAILIRRVFNANLTICAPYMSDSEQRLFQSRFAAVKTRDDYLVIREDLRRIAVQNGRSLLEIELW